MPDRCPICGGPLGSSTTEAYRACGVCGHELLAAGQQQQFMVNDRLEPDDGGRTDHLISYQKRVAKRITSDRRLLIDFGCGSGRFLAACRDSFTAVLGVEISAPSADFARSALGLRVESALPRDLNPPSLVTFWHSLEHLPLPVIQDTLDELSRVCDQDSRVLICVPNAAASQYLILGEKYPFFDVPNHLHQFTPQSLDLLMKRHHFEREKRFIGLPYLVFAWTQGILNLFQNIHNYAYFRTKRGWDFDLPHGRRRFLDLMNLISVPAALAGAIPLLALDLVWAQRRGAITACYRRAPSS
jgi:SAM-dependent methyltransferase